MTIIEVLEQARELLRSKGRITYRMLRLQFNLDDESLAALKDELIQAERVAADEDDKVLVWVGPGINGETDKGVKGEDSLGSNIQRLEAKPVTYTPPHLVERIRAEQAALEARGATDGERKTITALFADLKGSTALIEGLDPEEARAIIDPALQLMMDAVHRYEGYVAQALGDGIFALFGAPIAHEDHPQRALYAALRMQEEMRRYSDQVRLKHGVPLAMRVGVNTGEVVVRSIRKDDLHTDYVPVGHSTNLAARMEQMATPGSILITEHTRKLVEGYFELKALGAAQIKGVEEPLNVYEVLGAGLLRTRLQVSARRGLTRFVGRQSELEQLRRALDQARAGHGQLVGVMGEPGLGKSRLFHEFKLTSQSGCLVLEAYSVSHGKASPYLPVIELLKTYFQIQPQDDERTRREKVIGKVLGLDRSLEDTLPYLFALLGIEEQPSPLQQMDLQIRRQRTVDALKKLFLRESLNQLVTLVFEDLHWIDTETQGFLDILAESVASARILLLVNYRPEYRQEWGAKTYYTQLRLTPFGKEEAEEFLDALLGVSVGADLRVGPQGQGAHIGAPLEDLKRLILEKTEGTPFFMEEIVQELFEQGVLVRSAVGAVRRDRPSEDASTGAPLHIPPTVQGILAARIDRLAPDEKALLQQLAIIGREFPISLIRQVVTQSEDELYRLLSALQRKEFLYEQPAFPEVEYLFKHALTQEVAYNSVLQERRRTLHERTAQALEALYSSSLEDHYSELAHHYSRSGNAQKAIEYLQLSGQQALQRSANAEAITHLTTALELLKSLPDTPERTQRELTLQIALGVPLQAAKGYGSPEVGSAYERARALCQQGDETTQHFAALRGVAVFYYARAELPLSRELGEQLLHLAQRMEDPALLLEAHRALGMTLLNLGELVLARSHVEQALLFYDPPKHRSLAFLYAFDSGVIAQVSNAWTLWLLGYPDQARKTCQDALALAQELSHFYSLALALGLTALVHQLCREAQAAQKRSEAAMALCDEHGFRDLGLMAAVFWRWALAEKNPSREGIAQLHQSIDAYRSTGSEAGQRHLLALLAEEYGKVGQAGLGLRVLAEALDTVNKTGERRDEAELYRLKGTLTLQKFRVSSFEFQVPSSPQPLTSSTQAEVEQEAEECFLRAIEIARKQQAKSLELRATMNLVRLRQQQATQDASRTMQHEARTMLDEAHSMLSEIYNWFIEGFDTKDLQEAKALLDELP